MKKYLFIIASLFLFMNLKAGPPIDLIYLITNFENYDPYPWVIDADNLDNTWQIGPSYKIEFDTVYSMPNAIMTDTINPYPINNLSSFQFLISKPEWAQDNCLSCISVEFMHKYDTDTLKDGGYIDISYDLGNTWINIIDDTISTELFTYNFYNNADTITGDKRGFSGNSANEWISSGFEWFLWDNDQAHLIDSIMIRFNFISDGYESNNAGWIIDNIRLEVEDYCDVGINNYNTNNKTYVYPNPLSDISVLELPNNNADYLIRIFNIKGQEVFNCISKEFIELYRNDFYPGIYIYKISSSKSQTYVGKFIVE